MKNQLATGLGIIATLLWGAVMLMQYAPAESAPAGELTYRKGGGHWGIVTDHKTGCEYIVMPGELFHPRLKADGKPYCRSNTSE